MLPTHNRRDYSQTGISFQFRDFAKVSEQMCPDETMGIRLMDALQHQDREGNISPPEFPAGHGTFDAVM
jgi:hypothetical protein